MYLPMWMNLCLSRALLLLLRVMLWHAAAPAAPEAAALGTSWMETDGTGVGVVGYVRTDPSKYDPMLQESEEIEDKRTSAQCFCGSQSRNPRLWNKLFQDLHVGMAANPGFDGEWVHALCGIAYPIIFKAITVDPNDDTFLMHADCPAAIAAMSIVCAQSAALQRDEEPLPLTEAPAPLTWRRHDRVVRFEGKSVGDVFEPISLEVCLRHCEQTDGCLSVAHGPHGCHLKDRCVSEQEILVDVDDTQTEGYHTHYKEPCSNHIGGVSASGGRLQQLETMLLFTIRSLEFCFHCIDEAPWPFSLAEVLENYALATLAPHAFRWQRLDSVSLRARSKLDLPSDFKGLLDLTEGSLAPGSSWQLSKARLAQVRFVVRWHRGIESEVAFWKKKLSSDREVNDQMERLNSWLATGNVSWSLDDPCEFLELSAEHRASVVGEVPSPWQRRKAFRILNSGSGPFAPGPVECHMRRLGNADERDAGNTDGDHVRVQVPVVSTDGLARFYLRIFDEHDLAPPFVPQQCPVEELHRCFPQDYFDVVHMRNSLDHAFDPLLGIRRLLHVARPGGWVLLRHARNEGVPGHFRVGLHQWAFDAVAATAGSAEELHFLIWNPELRVDVTEYLLSSRLAATVRTRLRDHPSPDAPEDEKFVWVDIQKPERRASDGA